MYHYKINWCEPRRVPYLTVIVNLDFETTLINKVFILNYNLKIF